MDPNGQRFWLLAEDRHWLPAESPARVHFHSGRRALRLASQRTPPTWPARRLDALAHLEEIPEARDAFGTAARWNTERMRIVAGGAAPGEVDIYTPPGGEAPTDFLLGFDGVLYLAIGGGITLHDRRFRRRTETLQRQAFRAWRLAGDPLGGVWALDPGAGRLAHLQGELWPERPANRYDPSVVRPCQENPDPPRLRVLAATLPAHEKAVAIACSPAGTLAILTWGAGGAATLRVLDAAERLSPPVRLAGASYPYSLAWVSDDRVALMLPGVGEAPVYPVQPQAASVLPVGDLFPLRDHQGGPFLHGLSLPPHFPTRAGCHPLHRLSLPSFARGGGAMNATLIDSREGQTVWHRLYLEACIPPNCGIIVRLAASDLPATPLASSPDWFEHRFGSVFPPGDPQVPRGAWIKQPSELPFHPGLLGVDPEPERAGLFTVLIQRAGRRVRSLRGRYLWVRVELIGNGLSSPELAAVRAYGSRFSYVETYLPELYRENVFGPEADDVTRTSTRADFLERFLGNFEGVLTPLEDRIAEARLLTDPVSTAPENLAWLGSWVGLTLEPAHPPTRQRAILRAAPELAKWRGTVRGLALALDLATDGGVRGGEIVIVEDFRLRRTLATILGADLAAPAEDPLVGGLSVSGNSFVGDTLVLGDESRREFLALFAADLPKSAAEEAALVEFFEALTFRVTILVHQEVTPHDLGLIRRVVDRETPAHVEARVLAATHPLRVGISSLVGIDTYLRPKPEPRPVRVGRTRVGEGDFIISPPSLDPRLGGSTRDMFAPPSSPPLAIAGADLEVGHGSSFLLDGSRSTAVPGRELEWYRWTRMD